MNACDYETAPKARQLRWPALAAAILLAHGASHAQAVRVEVLGKQLDHPWGLAFLDRGRMLVTEKGARCA